ncbi:MAG: hypothetical protein ACI31G_01835 [Bacilli bacterium]
MKIKLTPEDKNKLEELIDIKEINMSMSFLMNDIFSSYSTIEINKGNIEQEKDEIIEKIVSEYEIDYTNEENRNCLDLYLKNNLHRLNKEDYLTNPYYQNIKITPFKKGNLKLEYLSYEPYELFPLNDLYVDEKYHELTPYGYFVEQFKFISLIENEKIWMLITPNEIETMKPHISKMKGNVILFGLGLGYIAYMLSEKEDIKHITIIENNKNIIEIFNSQIMPQIKHKEKIKIIYKDAFVYLKEEFNNNADYCFFDLWHNPNDALPLYLKIIKYEKKYPNSKFLYWIEDSIIALIRRCYISLFYETINNFEESNYLKSKDICDEVINKLYFYHKNDEINSFEEISSLLKTDKIKETIRKIY